MSPRWTAEQVAAITSTDDTLLSASAGTGKTTTLVGKILWALGLDAGRDRDRGAPIPPNETPLTLDRIAAITFTEKAAHDLQTKLRTAIEASERGSSLRWELERATVGTIHGFAADLLREHALRLDIDPTFRIVDPRETEIQQTEVVREVVNRALRERDPGAVELTRRYGLSGWEMSPGTIDRIRAVMRDLRWRAHQFDPWSVEVPEGPWTRRLDLDGLIERARFQGAWGEDEEDRLRDRVSLELSDALYRLGRASVGAWLTWLEHENARDFDSLILDARRLLTRSETRSALDAVRRRYGLLIIDEFQDTDRAQWEIARAIAAVGEDVRERPQLVLVGDPKQSIYRFRGADVSVWNEARDLFEREGRILELSWNFRCEPTLVGFVNRVGARALDQTALALERSSPESAVGYEPLRGAREPSAAAGLEWLEIEPDRAAERREEMARRVAGRLHEILGRVQVVDPDEGGLRRCRPSDIAILARRNDDLTPLEGSLRTCGIPFYNATTSGFSNRQEILDLVTALRLLENPGDDLRAFAFLRSPFVGLRDEVLVRIGLDEPEDAGARDGSLLARAARHLEAVESGRRAWFPAPESAAIAGIEREALASGLAAFAAARLLVDRVDHAELLETLLEETGYRTHLLLREGASEALANIESFLALLEEYRHLSLVRFLALWDRWGRKDLGIPQARLFSRGDDVVTLSTIHAAKGLEWPVVVLVGTGADLVNERRLVGEHWTDPALGPVFLPRKDERGPRAAAALARRVDQEAAEEARLLYVAATRARDRLIVVGPAEPARRSYATWLAPELQNAVEEHEARVSETEEPLPGMESGRTKNGVTRARAEDPATRTGPQIDAFGFDPDALPQLDLFGGGRAADAPGETPTAESPLVIRRRGSALQTSMTPPPVTLEWLLDIGPAPWPARVGQPVAPRPALIESATERALRALDPERWQLRYVHGVMRPEEFLQTLPPPGSLPPTTRGTLIHGVLERIGEVEELGRILDETLSSLDFADLELALQPGTEYRTALEREIARVVRSPEWRWYIEGPHHRELRFLFHDGAAWLQGAMDLYRPARPGEPPPEQVSLFDGPGGAAGTVPEPGVPWIIDFKTHGIEAHQAPEVAREYEIQAEIYRSAARIAAPGGERPRVALHFTHPNVAVEI